VPLHDVEDRLHAFQLHKLRVEGCPVAVAQQLHQAVADGPALLLAAAVDVQG